VERKGHAVGFLNNYFQVLGGKKQMSLFFSDLFDYFQQINFWSENVHNFGKYLNLIGTTFRNKFSPEAAANGMLLKIIKK